MAERAEQPQQYDASEWEDVERHLDAAIVACRNNGDAALDRLAARLAAELVDLRFQRRAHDE
jgi:hypothetical protein